MELNLFRPDLFLCIGHNVSRCASKRCVKVRYAFDTLMVYNGKQRVEKIIGKFARSSRNTVTYAINAKSSDCRQVLTRIQRFRYATRLVFNFISLGKMHARVTDEKQNPSLRKMFLATINRRIK